MKIRRFDELNDDTYNKAASQLRKLGHKDRSNALKSYVTKKNSPKIEVDDDYIINDNGSSFVYNFKGITFYMNKSGGAIFKNVDDFIKEFKEDQFIKFNFKITANFELKDSNLAKNIKRFGISLHVLKRGGQNNLIVNIGPLKFDRKSALKFKREILTTILDHAPLSDLISLLGLETELYSKIIEEVESISVNVINSPETNINVFTGSYIKSGYKKSSFTKSIEDLVEEAEDDDFDTAYSMLRQDDSITEAISISDYKKWSEDFNWDNYKELDVFFGKENRLYYDLKVNTSSFKVKVPDEITDFFGWNGYEIEDYDAGLCIDKDDRPIRIGKLLTRLGETDLLNTYNKSKENTLKNVGDLQVVISRHPYDIIGMSTNRGWTTCHDINDKRYGGKHLHHLTENLKSGTIIAYLIRKDDKNIKNPIARCLLKRNRFTRYKYEVDHHVYGTRVNAMTKFLKSWCDDINEKLIKKTNEELSPEVYKNAGIKLKSINHIKRGNNLIRYADHGSDNLKEYKYKIGHIDHKFDHIDYSINYQDRENDGSFDIDRCYKDFEDGELTEIVVMIDSLFESTRGDRQEAVGIVIEIGLNGKLLIKMNRYNGGLFDNRQSAVLYKKEVLSKIFDIVPLSDFFMLANLDVSLYKRIVDAIEGIGINNLYTENQKDMSSLIILSEAGKKGRVRG